MKKWCELSLKGDETASKIVLKLISNDFKIQFIIQLFPDDLGLHKNIPPKA